MSTFQSQSIAGYNGVFYVSTDGGTTYVAVGEVQDVTLTWKLNMLDSTSHSSAGSKNNTPGLDEWSASVGALSIFADAGQLAVQAALVPRTRLKFRFDPAGTTSGKPRREGFGYISQWVEKQPVSALVTEDLTITGDASLTYSTQP